MSLVDGGGCWAWVRDGTPMHRGGAALFVDRDGVIIEDRHFVSRAEDVALIPGAGATIARFNEARVPVVVVTNQSGVARGILTWEDFDRVEREVRRTLWAAAGAHLDAVFACGYHATGRGVLRAADHSWRKPRPGMVLAAAARLQLGLARSWLVGDRATDIEAAKAASLAGGLHVMTGHGDAVHRAAALGLAADDFEVRGVASLAGAIDLLEDMKGEHVAD